MTDKEQINDSLKNRDCKYYHPNNKCGLKAWCMLNAKKCNVNADYCQLKLRKQLARKTAECEELKKQLKNEAEAAKNEVEILNQACLDLTNELDDALQECELNRKIIDETGSECKRISKNYKEDEDRYRKVFEEIEGLAMNLRTRTDYHSLDEVNADIDNVLNIISKARGEKNAHLRKP